MSSESLLMYEIINEDQLGYVDNYRCNECFKYFETEPIFGESGEAYCSQDCCDDGVKLAEDVQDENR